VPIPAHATEVATDVGPLLFPEDDRVMRPIIERTGDWELDEATLFRALIPRAGTVVDVGAHVGYYTLLAAKEVGRGGRVIALEPHPVNAELLRLNVARNGFDRIVRVVEAAAWGMRGRVALAVDRGGNSGDHRVSTTAVGLEVDAVPLDALLDQEDVDVVKVDAQGTDQVAISGMKRTINRCRPVMLVELWPTGIRAFGADPADAVGYYASLGYRLTMPGVQVAFDTLTAEGFVEIADALPGGTGTLVLRPWSRP
jgi:FkbM family methyltransferase